MYEARVVFIQTALATIVQGAVLFPWYDKENYRDG